MAGWWKKCPSVYIILLRTLGLLCSQLLFIWESNYSSHRYFQKGWEKSISLRPYLKKKKVWGEHPFQDLQPSADEGLSVPPDSESWSPPGAGCWALRLPRLHRCFLYPAFLGPLYQGQNPRIHTLFEAGASLQKFIDMNRLSSHSCLFPFTIRKHQ